MKLGKNISNRLVMIEVNSLQSILRTDIGLYDPHSNLSLFPFGMVEIIPYFQLGGVYAFCRTQFNVGSVTGISSSFSSLYHSAVYPSGLIRFEFTYCYF